MSLPCHDCFSGDEAEETSSPKKAEETLGKGKRRCWRSVALLVMRLGGDKTEMGSWGH
jgi:hypothetical protein